MQENDGYQRESINPQVVPTINKHNGRCHLAKGGNILRYRYKANTLSKSRNSYLSFMLVIQGIQTLQHNCKKEITLPLEIPICNIGLDKEL